MQRLVLASLAQLTVKHLQGFDIDSSFGSLALFAEAKRFLSLLELNNDPGDTFHVNLYSALVIGRESRHQCGKGHCTRQRHISLVS